MVHFNNNILLLKKLRKLEFHYMNFKWKEINALSKLPRLEVLRLVNSNVGEKWELSENDKFFQLICLQIWRTDLKHWIVSADHFPKLERLLLTECYQLRVIPNSFADILTLTLIELRWCLSSTVMSAKKIQAETRYYGNENMVVIEKETQQMVVLAMIYDKTNRNAIFQAAAGIPGVHSVLSEHKGQKLTILGEMDAAEVVKKLGKVAKVEIILGGLATEEKKEEKKEKENIQEI